MGGWPYMALQAARDPRPAGRPGVAARALGAGRRARPSAHAEEHARLVETALAGRVSVHVLHRPRAGGTGRPAGGRQVTLGWLAERLTEFIDLHPEAEASVDRLASWLARLDDDEE